MEVAMVQPTSMSCPTCEGDVLRNYSYRGNGPAFLYFIVNFCNPEIETQITVPGESKLYRLCGVLYFAGNHFVARVVDRSGEVWYHDGCTTGEKLKYVKNANNMSNSGWLKTSMYRAHVLVYTNIF